MLISDDFTSKKSSDVPVCYVKQPKGISISPLRLDLPRRWSHARFRLGIESDTGPEPEKKRIFGRQR